VLFLALADDLGFFILDAVVFEVVLDIVLDVVLVVIHVNIFVVNIILIIPIDWHFVTNFLRLLAIVLTPGVNFLFVIVINTIIDVIVLVDGNILLLSFLNLVARLGRHGTRFALTLRLDINLVLIDNLCNGGLFSSLGLALRYAACYEFITLLQPLQSLLLEFVVVGLT